MLEFLGSPELLFQSVDIKLVKTSFLEIKLRISKNLSAAVDNRNLQKSTKKGVLSFIKAYFVLYVLSISEGFVVLDYLEVATAVVVSV